MVIIRTVLTTRFLEKPMTPCLAAVYTGVNGPPTKPKTTGERIFIFIINQGFNLCEKLIIYITIIFLCELRQKILVQNLL